MKTRIANIIESQFGIKSRYSGKDKTLYLIPNLSFRGKIKGLTATIRKREMQRALRFAGTIENKPFKVIADSSNIKPTE